MRAGSLDGLGRPPTAHAPPCHGHGLQRRHPETAAMKLGGLGGGGDGDGIAAPAAAAGHKEQDAAATGYVCLSALQLQVYAFWLAPPPSMFAPFALFNRICNR